MGVHEMEEDLHADELPMLPSLITYIGFAILIAVGKVRDFFELLFGVMKAPEKGLAPLVSGFKAFYIRRLYFRIQDAWNTPISSAAGASIEIMERTGYEGMTPTLTGKTRKVINLSSYNYLGFADPDSPCQAPVLESLHKYGVTHCSPRSDLGTTPDHKDLEDTVSRFLGKEDSMVFGMGFGTNQCVIPYLMGKGCLIISDMLNHSSIVFGARSAGCKIKPFRHNDVAHLEQVVREAIVQGQPRSHRPWKKILIIVEGIYSMEGEVCALPEIVRIKKKYKCYLYLDEAHSIGALGKSGRGACEHMGVDPADVDIMMGTFTKSFGAVGGYVSGSKAMISGIRAKCSANLHTAGMSPVCARQSAEALAIIAGWDGTSLGKRKIRQLHDNANYFRDQMIESGAQVLGYHDSPVVPVMLGPPAVISAFHRECMKEGIAVVVVGFPATELLKSRVRFCISASHTREQLDEALEGIRRVARKCHIRYKNHILG